ncbi:hypothetical protein ACGF0D_28635 [Kitasatospora sp. NPDC048298]|uniref:hypothetical protein n=1 Tax=Kitasatospora sp. NPDC048298 TaxID=3364049 RepID=UPI0037100D2A
MALSGAGPASAAAAPAVAAAVAAPVRAHGTDPSFTFGYTGVSQSLTVPANAVVTITADGAGGADNAGTSCPVTGTGGTGAQVVTTLPPSASPATLTINVGGTGGVGCNGSGTGGAGGFNGGAPGGGIPVAGFRAEGPGGGGASSVSAGGSLLVVAGGGGAAGGTGASAAGGNGGNGGTTPDATGGTAGTASGSTASPGQGGGGGSTTTSTGGAGGAAGTAPPCAAAAGGPGGGFAAVTVGTGGTGGSIDGGCAPTLTGAGGGGGGGYFAGGGGGSAGVVNSGTQAGGGGGGGGSSFATPTGTGTAYSASTIGTADHNGQVIISYTVPVPSLTITKTHARHFTQGERGKYTITVGNNGTTPTDGSAVTVTDTLPPGLHARSISGTGWTCTLSTLTCTRTDVLAPGSTYPPITLTVKATCEAHDEVTNTATVTGGGDPATHTATDPTTVKPDKHCCHDK